MKKLINIVIVGVVGLLIISLHYSCTTYEAPDGIAEDGFDSDSVISTLSRPRSGRTASQANLSSRHWYKYKYVISHVKAI